MEKSMGRVSRPAKYGCMRCKKPSSEWTNIAEDSDADDSVQTEGSVLAEEPAVAEMARQGQVAEKELGPHPRDDCRTYTNFHQVHFGQVDPVLLSCLVQKTITPCSLHLILSVHRVFWKIIHSFTKLRQQ